MKESFWQTNANQEHEEAKKEKLETGSAVFDFLERTKFLEHRQSDEVFDKWLADLSYEDYSAYLTRLNGLLRATPIKSRSIDGGNVAVSAGIYGVEYLPPAPEQKDGLMKEVFAALKEIPDNNDRALLEYYALQAIHPYADGNGRTGRLLYELISDSGKDMTSEKLSALLDHDVEGDQGIGTGRDSFAEKVLSPAEAYYLVNRELAKEFLDKGFTDEYGLIYIAANSGRGTVPPEAEQRLPQETVNKAKDILGEEGVRNWSFRGLALAKLLEEHEDLGKYRYDLDNPIISHQRRTVAEDIGKKIFALKGDKLMENLTDEELLRLIEIHKGLKADFIKTLIDAFKNPDKHQTKDVSGEDKMIKDYFKNL